MINVLDNDYSIKEMIGKGTFSTVRLAFDRESGEKVAIKILKKEKILNKGDLERAEREINILKKISHINLIKIYKTVEDSEAYYMVMEYCEKGELFNFITKNIRLDENESAYYFYQLINGLEYLHSLNIAHRDLKPENLLITKNNILKIIDFGLSNFSQMNKLLTTPCGSPCYASPEVVGGKQYDGNMIDIWATGIILFVMLCGALPFEGQTNEILFKKILQCKIEYPDYLSDISIDLLTKILEPNPENRIPLKEIKKHLFYLKGREIFRKIHPHLISKVENNNNNEECKNNTNYSKFVNKTEGNENRKSNNIKKLNTLNFKNLFFKIKNLNIIDKSKYNFYNTPKKKNKSKTKNNNFLIDVKSVNNSKNFKKFNSKEKETNNRNYERHLTDISDYSLNKNDILKNNLNLLTGKNIIKQLKYANCKKSSRIPSVTENNKVSTTQRLLSNQRNVFHSLDFNYSNFMFHNDNRKNFDDEPYYVYNSKKYKNLLKSINVDSLSFEKNRIKDNIPNNSIKKHKLLKLKEKYKFTENTKEHSNILDKKQKVFDIIRDLNLLNISKNNTLYNLDSKMINKTKRVSKKSNNNSQNKYKMGIKLNKIKKDIINLKSNNLFNKYFKLNNKRYFNHIKGNSNENNNYRNDNLNYDYSGDTSNNYNKTNKNKYKYNEAINTDFDKNIFNFRYPSVNISNMNYNLNLNLYTPNLYLSTLGADHSIKNSKMKYDSKNFNKNAEIELKNNNNKNSKYNKNKKDKLFNKIKIKEIKEKKEKKENDILASLNQKLMYQTHNNSIFTEKSFLNKNYDYDISKNDTNENVNINNKNHNNNAHSKENKKAKRIKGIKKLDFGFDLLNLLKQNDKGDLAYKNENKKKILNTEYDYRKICSPTNISEKNNLLVSCDNKIRYEYNELNDKPSLNLGKKKNNKMKIINNKNNNVLNSLIKDFIHFNNLNHKTYYTIDVSDNKNKNNKSLNGKPIM